MVSKSSNKSTAINVIAIVAAAIIINAIVFCVAMLGRNKANDGDLASDLKVFKSGYDIKPVDLQPTVDTWSKTAGGNHSVIIYDLDTDQTVASLNPDKKYGTASLYKLFVVYEGYRRLENGSWNPNDIITSGKTRLKCLDLAIRESHSPCAETLWAQIGHANLDEIIKNDFAIKDSDISHLISNPNDILKMLKIYYSHSDISDENWKRIADSMLNQPKTTQNWRQGLPSGFSNDVDVYNKVGWEYSGRDWKIYHDAAILDFKKFHRHFIIVVMTNHVSHLKIAELGRMVEAAVNDTLSE